MSRVDEEAEARGETSSRVTSGRAEAPASDVPVPVSGARLRIVLLLVDLCAGALAAVSWAVADQLTAVAAACGLGVFLAANRLQGLYRSYTSTCRPLVYAGLMRSALLLGATTWLVSTSGGEQPTPWATVLAVGVLFVAAATGRHAFDFWLGCRRSDGAYLRRVLLIAGPEDADSFLRLLRSNPAIGFEVVGVVGPRGDFMEEFGVAWLGEAELAGMVAGADHVSGAVLCPAGLPRTEVLAVVKDLERAAVHVHVPSGLQGIGSQRLRSVDIAHEPFLYMAPPDLSRWQLVVKRTSDVVLAALILLITAPVLLIAALLIKIQDGGPILFRQDRVGKGGRVFRIHKLRTMVPDAERQLEGLLSLNEREGPLFKLTEDPRVTRLGSFLRATSLDELPQLLDVLRGEMSLVGPRPALPHEVETFDDELLDRLSIRPGITGLWQVEARDSADFEAYRRLDLFYVENWSLLLDVAILLDTIPAVLGRAFGVVRSSSAAQELPPLVTDTGQLAS